MPQAGFNPPGEKWQLCLNIVVALPPKPPRLDFIVHYIWDPNTEHSIHRNSWLPVNIVVVDWIVKVLWLGRCHWINGQSRIFRIVGKTESHIFHIVHRVLSHTTTMATFVVLRHLVTTLVTAVLPIPTIWLMIFSFSFSIFNIRYQRFQVGFIEW